MRVIAVLGLCLAVAGLPRLLADESAAGNPPQVVTPAEAAKMVNQTVVLEMEVKSASLREGVCFLNSHENHRDAANFTVFINREALAKFRDAKIEDPAAHFKGKKIRVKGKVTLFREKPQIAISKADEVTLVAAATSETKK